MDSITMLSNSLGLPSDALRFSICILAGFPLSFLFQKIPASSPNTRHLFSILTSTFLIITIYTLQAWMHLVVAVVYTFAITAYLKSKRSAVFVTGLLLLHMAYIHMTHQIWFPNQLPDSTGTMMVLVMKLSSFAWSINDGHTPMKLTLDQQTNAIRTMPAFIELLGFSFFFLGVFVGPAFEFNVYHDFIHEINDFKTNEKSSTRFYSTFLLGVLLLIAHVLLTTNGFDFKSLVEFPDELGFARRMIHIYLCALAFRLQFAGAWKLTECICTTTRIASIPATSTPRTNKPSFTRACNIDIANVELAPNVRTLTVNWNKYTHFWLKRTVYCRVDGRFRVLATFIVSAFWHGFHPGYYLGFVAGALATYAASSIRKHIHPLVNSRTSKLSWFKVPYDLLGSAATVFVMSYMFLPVGVRTFEGSIAVWSHSGWIGHMACVASIVGLEVLPGAAFLKRVFAVKSVD